MKTISNYKMFFIAIVLASSTLASVITKAQELRNVSEYNLQETTGLKGFDPVSYFPEGGSQPLVGLQDITLIIWGLFTNLHPYRI